MSLEMQYEGKYKEEQKYQKLPHKNGDKHFPQWSRQLKRITRQNKCFEAIDPDTSKVQWIVEHTTTIWTKQLDKIDSENRKSSERRLAFANYITFLIKRFNAQDEIAPANNTAYDALTTQHERLKDRFSDVDTVDIRYEYLKNAAENVTTPNPYAPKPLETLAFRKASVDWEAKEDNVKLIILQTVSPYFNTHLHEASLSSKERVELIRNLCIPINYNNKQRVIEQWQQQKIHNASYSPIDWWTNHALPILEVLKILGKEIPRRDILEKILSSLPRAEYQIFHQRKMEELHNIHDDNNLPKPIKLISDAQSFYEISLTHLKPNNNGGTPSLYSGSKGNKTLYNKSNKNNTKNNKIVCNHCHKPGHTQQQCFRLHPELLQKKAKNNYRSANQEQKKKTQLYFDQVPDRTHMAANTQGGDFMRYVIIDSANSRSICNNINLFENIEILREPHTPLEGSGTGQQMTHGGWINIITDKMHTIRVYASYNPDYASTLISLLTLQKQGYMNINIPSINGTGSHNLLATHKDGQTFNVVGTMRDEGNITVLNTSSQHPLHCLYSQEDQNSNTHKNKTKHNKRMQAQHAHVMFGHPCRATLVKICNRLGIRLYGDIDCHACSKTKIRQKISHKGKQTKRKNRLHLDLMVVRDKHEGNYITQYILTGTHEPTDYRFVSIQANKSAKTQARTIKEWIAFIDRQYDSLQAIRIDGGTEFRAEVENTVKKLGIKIETTTPHSPFQNGFAERANRTLLQQTVATLTHGCSDITLWPFATTAHAYIHNITPNRNDGKTPLERFDITANAQDHLKYLKPLFCESHHRDFVKSIDKHKFSPASRKSVLVGYTGKPGGYIVLDIETKRITRTNAVNFRPSHFPLLFPDNKINLDNYSVDYIPVGSDEKHDPSTLSTLSLSSVNNNIENEHLELEHSEEKEEPQEHIGVDEEDDEDIYSEIPETITLTQNQDVITITPNISFEPEENSISPSPQEKITISPSPQEKITNPRGQEITTPRRSSRVRQPTSKYDAYHSLFVSSHTADTYIPIIHDVNDKDKPTFTFDHSFLSSAPTNDPSSVSEAIHGPNADEWKEAILQEFQNIENMQVFLTVPTETVPKTARLLGTKWVLKTKYHPDGTIDKRKARLCAQGFRQRHGFDYEDTYSPTGDIDAVRLLLALYALAPKNRTLRTGDIPSAYLHASLEEEVYLRTPIAVKVPDGHTIKLQRSLYGLKQSGREWYKKISSFLTSKGYSKHPHSDCLFIKHTSAGEWIIILLYVDDVLTLDSSRSLSEQTWSLLHEQFSIKEKNPYSTTFLGMEISEKEEGITLNQQAYITTIMERFGMTGSKTVATTASPSIRLDKAEEDEEIIHNMKLAGREASFLEVTGSINWLRATRPDIVFTLSKLQSSNAAPTKRHWKQAMHLLRYLRSTSHVGLFFKYTKGEVMKLTGYTDSDWASDRKDRISVSGALVTMNGSPIDWKCIKQASVALSTAEAEYIAAFHGTKLLTAWRNTIKGFGSDVPTPMKLHIDNAAAIKHVTQASRKQRHIDIAYHYAKQEQERGNTTPVKIASADNPADLFTKILSKPTLEKLRKMLMTE